MNNRVLLLAIGGFLGLFMLIGIIAAFTMWGANNSLVDKEEAVKSQWGQVLNVYQRRADLIPNLVETVKGSADFEKGTLTAVTDARSRLGSIQINENSFKDPAQVQSFFDAQNKLSSSLGRLMVVSENYPQLRSTEAFRDLQAQLEGSENRIANERKKFNEAVKDFNSTVRKLPTSLFAGFLGFQPLNYFEGDAGIEKAPKVKF